MTQARGAARHIRVILLRLLSVSSSVQRWLGVRQGLERRDGRCALHGELHLLRYERRRRLGDERRRPRGRRPGLDPFERGPCLIRGRAGHPAMLDALWVPRRSTKSVARTRGQQRHGEQRDPIPAQVAAPTRPAGGGGALNRRSRDLERPRQRDLGRAFDRDGMPGDRRCGRADATVGTVACVTCVCATVGATPPDDGNTGSFARAGPGP